MIDYHNYTPAPAKESIQVPVPEVTSAVGKMLTDHFPGVCDSATFVLVLLAIFIIGTPIVLWLVDKWKKEEKREKKKEGKK
jgi:hypothetical protein